MTCPQFVTEMNGQLQRARAALAAAIEAADHEARAMAEARLSELADLTRRHGVDVRHVAAHSAARDAEPCPA